MQRRSCGDTPSFASSEFSLSGTGTKSSGYPVNQDLRENHVESDIYVLYSKGKPYYFELAEFGL